MCGKQAPINNILIKNVPVKMCMVKNEIAGAILAGLK